MFETPLFPLNTVLFPGAPLQLHIFEARYIQMINNCIDKQAPFGVLLIKQGAEALGPLAEPHLIGTMAHIQEIQRLPDGRMNILVVGKERIRIYSVERDLEPYLVGYGEFFPIQKRDQRNLNVLAERLRTHLGQYLLVLAEAGIGHFEVNQFPEDPVELAYLSVAMMDSANLKKQEILAIEYSDTLLEKVDHLFRSEIALMRQFLKNRSDSGVIFSKN